MHLVNRLRRPLAFIFAVLLVVGSASPVQAASKKERRYYSYTSGVMLYIAKDVHAGLDFDLTAGHLKVVEEISQDPWMFSTSNRICKMMIAAKTSAQRKRVSREVVGTLSDLTVEDLEGFLGPQLDGAQFGMSEDEVYFWAVMAATRYVTLLSVAQELLCKGQSKHIEPMIDAYLSAAEKKVGRQLGA